LEVYKLKLLLWLAVAGAEHLNHLELVQEVAVQAGYLHLQ
jgi:hypothetical protein